MGKRIFKRFFASFLALILAFLCGCFPSAFASESGGFAMPSDERAVAIGDALAEMGGLDGGWSLAIMSYFSANGISLESYGNDGEDLTRVIMKYYDEYYEELGLTLSRYDFIANIITATALGISRVVGAVDGAFNLLIRAPVAAELHRFLDWWNEKFNPSGESEANVTSSLKNNSVLPVVYLNGDPYSVSVIKEVVDGQTLYSLGDYSSNSLPFEYNGTGVSPLLSEVELGTPLFLRTSDTPGNLPRLSALSVSFGSVSVPNYGYYYASFSSSGSLKWRYSQRQSSQDFYLFANYNGIYALFYPFSGTQDRLSIISGIYPFSYFYSNLNQFSSSGLSILTMAQSSDGRLSYGPSGSSAGTIIQSGETISIPVVAPSIEGNAVSFSAVDTVADLLAKALTIVEDSVADAADTALELPSTVGELIPDIELFDDLEINWADDTPVTLTPSPSPSPSPVPDLPVTVIPTSFPSPWPVSPDQFAVVTSDGRTALVDITDTIKGWTESLTGIYQSYVDLLGSVFGFLPEEIQVLFKWSMAALVFTGVFKRFWWDHH